MAHEQRPPGSQLHEQESLPNSIPIITVLGPCAYVPGAVLDT